MTGIDPTPSEGRPAQPEPGFERLRCPSCLIPLQPNGRGLFCVNCSRHYAGDGNIIDLRVSPTPGGNCNPPADLPDIVAPTQAAWAEAIRTFVAGRDGALPLLDALVSGRHNAWRGFLDLKPDSYVLCLGGGYGSVAQSLAPHCARVFVLEPNPHRLRFIQKRLAVFGVKEGVAHITGHPEGRLPFADEALDAVVMVDPSVFAATSKLIGEVQRVLQKRGQLLLLSDNRFSLALPAGWWDQLAGMPRPLPDLIRAYSLMAGWWRKRTGTQSLATLRRRVTSRGLSVSEVLGLWPSRSQFDEILPLNNASLSALPGESDSRRQRIKRASHFLPAHVVVAQSGGSRRVSSYERICMAVSRDLRSEGKAAAVRPLRYFVTRKDKMIMRAQSGGDQIVIRIALSAAAAGAEVRHAAAVAQLLNSHPSIAPRPVAAGRIDTIDYWAETALAGSPLRRVLAHSSSVDILERVQDLLKAMNPTSTLTRRPLAGDAYTRLIEARLMRLFEVVREPGQQRQLRAFFRERLYGVRLPLGLVHGDFSASNIYISGEGVGVIDWEAVDFEDLPILDAIGYLESTLRRATPNHSLAESYWSLAWNGPQTEPDRHFLFGCYEWLGVDRAYHPALVYLRWLRQIDYLMPYWLQYDPDRQKFYIHEVVGALLQKLE